MVLGRGGGGGQGGFLPDCAHLLNIHNCCKMYRIIYSEGVGEVVVVLGGGGGEGGGAGGGGLVERE